MFEGQPNSLARDVLRYEFLRNFQIWALLYSKRWLCLTYGIREILRAFCGNVLWQWVKCFLHPLKSTLEQLVGEYLLCSLWLNDNLSLITVSNRIRTLLDNGIDGIIRDWQGSSRGASEGRRCSLLIKASGASEKVLLPSLLRNVYECKSIVFPLFMKEVLWELPL